MSIKSVLKKIPDFKGANLLIRVPLAIVFILQADIVIMPAMCNIHQFELRVAHFFRKRIIVDFYLSLYDTMILDRLAFNKESKKAKDFLLFDRRCVDYASDLFFLNNSEARYYLELIGRSGVKNFKIIPLCIEQKVKCQLPYFRKSSKTLNICWWGSYIPLHGLDLILDAALILKNKDSINVHFYLFGNDSSKSKLYENFIAKNQLSSQVTVDNSYTFNNGKLEPFLANHCDLVLGSFGKSLKAKTVLVNKLVDGIAMKAPILSGYTKGAQEFFTDDDIFFADNDPNEIANRIIEVSKVSEKSIDAKVDRAYEKYLKYFSTQSYFESMKAVIG